MTDEREPCMTCRGVGKLREQECPRCHGMGLQLVRNGSRFIECEKCNGRGVIGDRTCPECDGEGEVEKE